MADACAAAADITGDTEWVERALAAIEWFWGRNDGSRPMTDITGGAGFDGLHCDGANQNAGAESTISALGAHCTWSRLTNPMSK